MRWKRKLLIACGILVALVVVGVGVLWFVKPWVPEIELTDPGPTGERIVTRDVFANYFAAKDAEQGPAVMLLGGSEGGIGDSITRAAIELQEEGFSVLTPSYFGAPGQPDQLELVPLETFDHALEWLRSHEIDPQRVAVVGQSKGAEAALLVGVRHPELRAVVASAPSSYVWPGIDWNSFKADPSWTSDGEPLPVLPYGPFHFSALLGDIGRVYVEGLEKRADHPEAAIKVEDIRAPVLLVCGEDDELWPACPMSRELQKRAAKAGAPQVRILAYQGAGHRVFGPPVALDHPSLGRFGGTPAGNNAARKDAWPQVIEFLRTHLR